MKSFKISTYNISSTRLTGKQKVTFAILADLHGLVFGKNHQTLYKAIIASQPDAVLVCGDLVVSRDTETLEAAAGLLLGSVIRFLFLCTWKSRIQNAPQSRD